MNPNQNRSTDAGLVLASQRAPRGDHRAFNQLVERHLAHVRANCEHISGSRDDGADLAQEVFVKAYFSLEDLADGGRFRGWISRIKVNHCLDHLRRERSHRDVDLDTAVDANEAALRTDAPRETDLGERTRDEQIRAVLTLMPESLRVPLVLCDIDGLSYQEVADTLNLGLSATKMRIKRAREHFRKRFERHQSRWGGESAPDPIAMAARE